MISRGIVPNLVISQRMVDKVVRAAQGYLEDETGETMVGIVVDTDEPETMPTLYVLDTIAPDESVIRRTHMFEQGDELQQDIFFWLVENWNVYQDIGRDMSGKPIQDEWRVPLKHLGDWHKQPGFMIQPSGGDLGTALRIMDDEENEFEFLLVPIVTLGHESVTIEIEGARVNYFNIPMDNGTSLRMDWWYIHRDVRVFQPISPTIVSQDKLPDLTPYPWHILDRNLLDEEIRLLQDDGKWLTAPNAIFWEADGDLPLEICFIIGSSNTNKVFLIITDWDYPRQKPRIRVTDFAGVDPSMYIYDVFQALWEKSELAPEPEGFEWNPEASYIVDYIALIEQTMGVRPEDMPMPWERDNEPAPVGIPLEVEGDEPTIDNSLAENNDVVPQAIGNAADGANATPNTTTETPDGHSDNADDESDDEPVSEISEDETA